MTGPLLNCPFCGGEADLAELPGGCWAVGCHSDACGLLDFNCYRAPEEAIIDWNRRAVTPLQEAERAVVEAAEWLTRFDTAGNMQRLYEAVEALQKVR